MIGFLGQGATTIVGATLSSSPSPKLGFAEGIVYREAAVP